MQNPITKYYARSSAKFPNEKNRHMDTYAIIIGLGFLSLIFYTHVYMSLSGMANPLTLVILIIVGITMTSDQIFLPFSSTGTMLGTATLLMCLFNYGPLVPVIILLASMVVWLYLIGLPKWRGTVFNICQFGISMYAAYFMFLMSGGEIGHITRYSIVPLVLAAIAHVVINLVQIYIFGFLKMRYDVRRTIKIFTNRQYIDSLGLYAIEMFFAIAMTLTLANIGLWCVIVLMGILWFTGATHKRYKELLITSYQDALTGLYNRRYFNSTMKDLFKNGNPACLFMIDVDHFKKYNDMWGHMKGDLVLQEIAKIIEVQCSTQGITCRYGGEEFAVLIPAVEISVAEQLAEGVRKAVESSSMEGAECMPEGKITVSIGIASYPHMGKTHSEILESADQALYEAKRGNRNQVRVFMKQDFALADV